MRCTEANGVSIAIAFDAISFSQIIIKNLPTIMKLAKDRAIIQIAAVVIICSPMETRLTPFIMEREKWPKLS
jgi:hypothetical protein